MTWEEVTNEMVNEKSLDPAAVERIGQFVRRNGSVEICDQLEQDLKASKSAIEGIQGIRTFLNYADLLGISKHVVFDLSLARGLDYYTGVIYEAVLTGKRVLLNTYKQVL